MTLAAHPNDEAILDLIARVAVLERGGVYRSILLADLDVSSLDFMAMLGEVEERCARDIGDGRLAMCQTLGDLIDVLRAVPGDPSLGGSAR